MIKLLLFLGYTSLCLAVGYLWGQAKAEVDLDAARDVMRKRFRKEELIP